MGKLYKPDEFDSITELNIPFLFEDLNSVPNELDIQAILKVEPFWLLFFFEPNLI